MMGAYHTADCFFCSYLIRTKSMFRVAKLEVKPGRLPGQPIECGMRNAGLTSAAPRIAFHACRHRARIFVFHDIIANMLGYGYAMMSFHDLNRVDDRNDLRIIIILVNDGWICINRVRWRTVEAVVIHG